jgi:hypothetical protein
MRPPARGSNQAGEAFPAGHVCGGGKQRKAMKQRWAGCDSFSEISTRDGGK